MCSRESRCLGLKGENRNTTIIDANGIGNVINITKHNVTVMGFTIQKCGTWSDNNAIRIHTGSNSIIGNIIQDNGGGIGIIGGYGDNIISNNTIQTNYEGIGIGDGNNTIINNYFTKNNISISMWNPQYIANNNFIDNTYGLEMRGSDRSTIISNNFIENQVPIWMKWTILCNISKNNFINNEEDPYFQYNLGMTCRQYWNENYWSGLPDDSKYKVIFGVLIIFSGGVIYPGFSIGIHWPNLDWHPAKEPYDIKGG